MVIRRALTESAFVMGFARMVLRCGWTITERVDAIWGTPHSSQRQPPLRVHHQYDMAVSSARMTLRSITQRALSTGVKGRLRPRLFWREDWTAARVSYLDVGTQIPSPPKLPADDTDAHKSTQNNLSTVVRGLGFGWNSNSDPSKIVGFQIPEV